MAIFGPKPWVNPFGKMSVFRLFEVFLFQPRKAFSRSRVSLQTFSWPILPKKKSCKKWPFLAQNHGLTPLEKCQYFDFLNFFFLQPRKAFFFLEYRKRHFPCRYCLKKKGLKEWPFLDQNHRLTTLEKCQVFDLLNFLFSQPTTAFFRCTIP